MVRSTADDDGATRRRLVMLVGGLAGLALGLVALAALIA